MTAAGAALRRCVGDPHRFIERYWGAEPLHRPGRGEESFADLLDLPDVDRLLTETLLRMPSFRLVKDGTPLEPSTYTQTIRVGGRTVDRVIRPDRVLDAFRAGATIVLQALHRSWSPVGAFCRDLELALTHPVQANAYVTPPTAQGFAVHHDTHDVLVLQTRGAKRWRVFRPVVELAGPGQPWKRGADPGEPTLEAELSPGDALYIPRGFPHDAEAREEVSIHVTLGVLTYTWMDLWRDVMKRAADHRPFREALPPGFAHDPEPVLAELGVRLKDLQAWLEQAATEEVVRGFVRRFWRTRRPILPGHLRQLEVADRLGPGSAVRRREGSVLTVSVEGGEAVAELGMRELRMPAFCAPALRFAAAAGGTFCPDELPGLDESSRVVLARRLVREGVLEVDDGAGA